MATVRLGIDMGSSTTTIFRVNSGLARGRTPCRKITRQDSRLYEYS